MASQGKRMVPERLIKEIGQGGGSEYTAGTGIDITEDVISVDTETIATVEYVDEHSGSVDIDNKTIVENLDGELETAVGGYTETEIINLDPATLTSPSGADWDLIDETLCLSYLETLEVGVHYPIQIEFTGTTIPSPGIKSAEIYVDSNTITGGFGNQNDMFITDNEDNIHTWKFSVKEDGYNIHVWPRDSWISPTQGSTITITPATITKEVLHRIDSKYLNYEFKMASNYMELSDNDFNYIYNNRKVINIITQDKKYFYQNEDNNNIYFAAVENNYPIDFENTHNGITSVKLGLGKGDKILQELSYGSPILYTDNQTILRDSTYEKALKTAIGGGYKDKFLIDKTLLASYGDNYASNQADLISTVENTIKYIIKNIYSGSIQANNTFRMWPSDPLKIADLSESRYPSLVGDITVGSDGDTITYNWSSGNSGIGLDQLVYSYSTDINTTSPTKFVVDSNGYNFIIDSINDVYLVGISDNISPEAFNAPILVDSKFLPAFNVAPTAAGTYKLQATVDAQGNVTYAWVLEV